MELNADEISQILKDQIKNFESRVSVSETGTIQ
jgi:F0F1-type ATP synthase alpha subunit